MAEKTKFHASYEYPDGDIVLRTSDDVCFRAHSIILRLASSFFRQMLDIPRSLSESPADAIPLSEPSNVIACLFDLVYPTADGEAADGSPRLPKIRSFEFAWAVTNAADKYEMPRALAAVRAIVMNSEYLRAQPLELYALASRWKWTEEARVASTATLSAALLRIQNFEVLRSLDADSLCKLLELHTKRKDAILRFFDLKHRESKNFIVYQWECGCSTDLDGTKTEAFMRQWEAMRCHVIASLDASPLGEELRESTFWSRKDFKLWSFACHNCGKVILNKNYFVKRIGEVFQSASLPTCVE